MIGTGRLRMTLQRQGLDPTRRAQRSALISLAGRLIGLAANLERTFPQPGDDDAIRLARTICEARGNSNRAPRVRGHFRISSCARGAAVL